MASDPALLLTFEQSTVYVSDYSTLSNRKWLNDTIIGFSYDVFAHKIYQNAPKNSILFVHPTTVNVIKFENDEEDLIPLIKDSGIPIYDYIFLPINNSQSMFSVSGSHWALLIYQRYNNTFYYLDSAGTYNLTFAQSFANKIYPYINPKKKEKNHDNDDHNDEEKKQDNHDNDDNHNDNDKDIDFVKVLNNFIKLKVPQQENSYDCGMYVVEFTRFVAKYYMENKNNKKNDDQQKQFPCVSNAQFFNKQNKFDSHYMIDMRKNWRQIINDMSKQQKTEDDKK